MKSFKRDNLSFLFIVLLASILLNIFLIDPSEEKSLFLFHSDDDSVDSRLVLHNDGSATVERIFNISDSDMIQAFIDQDRMNIRVDGLSSYIDPKSFMATVVQPIDDQQVIGLSVAGGNQRVNASGKKENSHYLMFKEHVYTSVSDNQEMKDKLKEKLMAEQRGLQKKIVSYENMKKQVLESKFKLEQYEEKLKLVDNLIELIEKNQERVDELQTQIQDIGKSQKQSNMYFEFSSKVPEIIKSNPKPFTLKVKYIILKGIKWTPQYLLSLDSKTQTGHLMFMANVAHKTGENFTNALVELSTDKLGQAPSMPDLEVLTLEQTPIYKYIRTTPNYHSFTKRASIGSVPYTNQRNYQNQFGDSGLESIQSDQNSQVTTDVIKSTTSFMISDRASFITIPNEAEKSVSLLIANVNLDSKWYHKVIPKQSTNVFTILAIKNKSKYQLIPGDVNVFINNVLSTQSRIKTDVFPNDIFQLDIGIDRMVSVRVNDHQQNEQTSGWLFTTNSVDESSQITIENKKDVPINITVVDALPYTENWHTDDKLQILLTQPKNEQGKDIDIREIFLPTPKAEGKETIFPTEYQFNTSLGQKQMKCKIKKKNHSLERNFTLNSKENIIMPLSYQLSVTLSK